jgi:hypothetical protein
MKTTLFLCAGLALTCAVSPALMAESKCPPTLSYQDIQDVVKPDGKTVNGLTLTPKSLPDYLSNMPQGDITAKLDTSSGEGGSLICTYTHHGGVAGAGNYKLDIVAKAEPAKK